VYNTVLQKSKKKSMAEKISTLQQALHVVEALDPEEQAILVDVISKRLSLERRNELLKEVAQARDDYQQGNVKRGSVADLMAELDE
jgi:hypothetical protein